MVMKLDMKEIIDETKGKNRKGRISLYLDKTVYEGFCKECGVVSTSKVVEKLMRLFIESKKSAA